MKKKYEEKSLKKIKEKSQNITKEKRKDQDNIAYKKIKTKKSRQFKQNE